MKNKEIFKEQIKNAVVEQLAKSLISEEVLVSFREEIINEFKELCDLKEVITNQPPISIKNDDNDSSEGNTSEGFFPQFGVQNSAFDAFNKKLETKIKNRDEETKTLVDRILSIKHGLSKDRVFELLKDFREFHSTPSLFEQDLENIEERIKYAEEEIKKFAESILSKQEDSYDAIKLIEGRVDSHYLVIGKDQLKEISELKDEITNLINRKDVVLDYQKFQNGNNYYVSAEIHNKKIEESRISDDTILSLGSLKKMSESEKKNILEILTTETVAEDTKEAKEFNFKLSVVYNDTYKSYDIDVCHLMIGGAIIQWDMKFQAYILDLPFVVSLFEKIKTIASDKAKEQLKQTQ